MDIIMLGHSNVGKTTYVASMYAAMQTPVNGFSVRASEHTAHHRLSELAKRILHGQYPAPSDQRSQYNLQLLYNGRPVVDFRWKDYRGDALAETSASRQARELVADLRAADGIVLFCESTALQDGIDLQDQIGTMTYLVGEALEGRKQWVPLVIALTKTDRVEQLDDRLVEAFEGLCGAIAASPTTVGTVIPVACGRRCLHVQLPVLFCLHMGIAQLVHTHAAVVKQHRSQAEAYEDRASFWDTILSPIFGEDSYQDLAEREWERAIAEYQRLEPLLDPAQALEKYLEELPRF